MTRWRFIEEFGGYLPVAHISTVMFLFENKEATLRTGIKAQGVTTTRKGQMNAPVT
ncbi:hypothetical protein KO561_00795 [Radiobacillus kanasensis]|uniref:hypothetical protein n=1 Tax=Radiobacillus kanasensis TaxID=2844358 RepID=UPI001E456435|nr:hypothetical protein [Radiobacillus kanasensis]UFT99551.1 hypothetical protein KO561_00795 [Radiobacillus kanasensis]